MHPAEANALLTIARDHDNLVPNTDENMKTWARHLEHVPFEAGKVIVSDYYGAHPDPDRRKPISAAHIRQLYRKRATVAEAHQRATHQLPRPKRSPVPRWFIEKGQRDWGAFEDRNPADYA